MLIFLSHSSRVTATKMTELSSIGFSFLVVFYLFGRSNGFPFHHSTTFPIFLKSTRATHGTTHLFSSPEDRETIMARNNARTCVKSFLTQRAIQSFMFLLEECRDPHSGKWIEEFLGLQNLLEYHGTGAFDIERFPMWEMVLLEMMEQPKDEYIIHAKRRGAGHGGWSKNNPHLPERFVEIPIEIDPASLAQRILSVRGQISNEFVQDLDIVISTNDQILESYFSNLRREDRDAPQDLASSFDHTTSYILSSNMESSPTASSPFRKGNFDLLYNLCTQASIHELLRQFKEAGEEREVSFVWLRNFYVDRVEKFFDGDQPYGRADGFIEEMLLTPPSVKDMGTNKNGKAVVGLIDPMGLAEQIIQRRTQIAHAWKETMDQTASDHMQLQKVLLAKIMGKDVDDFKRDFMQQKNDSTEQSMFE